MRIFITLMVLGLFGCDVPPIDGGGVIAISYDADFYDFGIGLQRDGLSLRAAFEHHGGSNAPGEAFQAPIGRVHFFRG